METNDIFNAASGINQYRLHSGYHYPRAISTATDCRDSVQYFCKEYPESIISDTEQYYCISKRDSLISGEAFVRFCEELNLRHTILDLDILRGESVDVCMRVNESIFDLSILQDILLKLISQKSIKIEFGVSPSESQLGSYDYVIVATYTDNNQFISADNQQQYQYELCEKPVIKLPSEYDNIGLVVMDGPFMCIDPLGRTGYHVMGNVVHAIHQTSFGEFVSPLKDNRFAGLINRGIIENPVISNFPKFVESASEFLIGIEKCEHIGSMFTYRVVLPNMEETDDRPTIVKKVDHRTITIFSGKITTCVMAANKVVAIIKETG